MKPGSINDIRKKMHKNYEFILTSYHESGHSIYALLHLMKVDYVSVFENKKSKRIDGITCYNCPDNTGNNDLLRIEAGVNYAGLVAEKYFFRSISGSDQTPKFIIEGASEDNMISRMIIKKHRLISSKQKMLSFKHKLIGEINDELHQHWNAVTIIAHGLFRYRTLSFQDLKELLVQQADNKKFWKEKFKRIDLLY